MTTSTNGGVSWGSPSLIATGAGQLPQAKGEDMQAAFDSTGNLFLCYTTPTNTAVVLARTRDLGSNWTDIMTFPSAFADRPVLATGSGGTNAYASVWLMYIDGSQLTVRGAGIASNGVVSTNDFTNTVFSPGCSSGGSAVSTGLAVGPGGKVMMAYESRYDQDPENRKIFINVDTDGLGGFKPTNGCVATLPVNMNFQHGVGSFSAQVDRGIFRVPVLAWDTWASSPYWNRAYLAYTDAASTNLNETNTDIWVRYSTDTGTNWSEPVKVNTDSPSSQFFAGLAVDPGSGWVAVSWYDCRNDASNESTQLFAAVSKDGFSTRPTSTVQINPGSSYSHQTDCYDSTLINHGDYVGLAFHGRIVIPVWCSYAGTGDSCADVHACRLPW